MNLIQVVPGLPPRVDGIGDYALQLARQLRENQGVQSTFIVGDPEWNGGEVEGFYATKVASQTPQGFLDAVMHCTQRLGSDVPEILIQFSPYGYQKRGYPLWFQQALEMFAELHPGKLHFAYHELEVNSWKVTSSQFWVRPLQVHLIGRVAKLGNFQYTNTELYRGKLESWGSGRITLTPNFSTVGEPRVMPAFELRQKNVVVFGRGDQRKWNYEHGSEVLAQVCRLLGAERIIDIGEPIKGPSPDSIGGVPIVRCGRLSAEDVNEWMATSLGSFMYYDVPRLTKSSVHAVSCAHGTMPFIFDDSPLEKSCPGLVDGEDYIAITPRMDTSKLVLPPLRELSETVYRNYQTRASWNAAATVARHIFGL